MQIGDDFRLEQIIVPSMHDLCYSFSFTNDPGIDAPDEVYVVQLTWVSY